MVDVSHLVSQMHETLSTIHSTIASLSTAEHDANLDALEQQRDSALAALRAHFELEADKLAHERRAAREALAERRRREDEEREARRRREDEEAAGQAESEDGERRRRLEGETAQVEEETDGMMESVEEEARRMIEEGKAKLAALEEKRRDLNRQIDEQFKMPLPSAPTRRRARGGQQQHMPPAIAATSKTLAPAPVIREEPVGNNHVKAPDAERPEAAPRDVHESPEEEGEGEREVAKEREPGIPGTYESDEDRHTQDEASSEARIDDDAEPAESKSLFGKMGNAVLSLVGAVSNNQDETDDHPERKEKIQSALSDNDPRSEHGDTTLEPDLPQTHDSRGEDPENERQHENIAQGHEMEAEPKHEHPTHNEQDPLGPTATPQHDHDEEDEAVERSQPIPADDNREAASEEEERAAGDESQSNGHRHGLASSNKEEEFDLSGNEPIQGTMTHGVDRPELLTPLGERHLDQSLTAEDDYLTAGMPLEVIYEDEILDPSLSAQDEPGNQWGDENGSEVDGDGADQPAEEHDEGNRLKRGVVEHDSPEVLDEEDSRDRYPEPEGHGGWDQHQDREPRIHEDEVTSDASSAFISNVSSEVMDPTRLDTDARDMTNDDDDIYPDDEADTNEMTDDDTLRVDSAALVRDDSHFDDEDDAPEPSTPTEATAPVEHAQQMVQPYIEYVPEDRDSRADYVPEQSQHPSQPRDVRVRPDLSVPEVDGTLNEVGLDASSLPVPATGGFEDAVSGLVPEPELAAEDPGVHEGLDESGPVSEAGEGTQSDQPTPWYSTRDTESQAFATPLQSTGFRSPLVFDEEPTYMNQGLSGNDGATEGTHAGYGLGTETAATMDGQDDLFDDDYSNESAGTNGSKTGGSGAAPSDGDGEDVEEDDPAGDEQAGDEHVPRHADDEADSHVQATAQPKTPDRVQNDQAHPVTTEHNASQHSIDDSGSFTNDSGYRSQTPANELRNWADEVEHALEAEQTTPQLGPQTTQEHSTPEISPISLRQASPVTPFRGLADSRHAPRHQQPPTTPPNQTPPRRRRDEEGLDSSSFMPRDVTHLPWHARHDSVPLSLHSQTTLSSSPSSPIHAALPIDNHEPVIRDSWPRTRTDSTSDLDAFRFDASPSSHSGGGGGGGGGGGVGKSPLAAKWAARREHGPGPGPGPVTPPASQRNSLAVGGSPGSLFQKMRSIFEPGGAAATEATPPRSRPVSGVWYSVGSKQQQGQGQGQGEGEGGADDDEGGYYDVPGEGRGGFLNEASEEIDERSALLRAAPEEEALEGGR